MIRWYVCGDCHKKFSVVAGARSAGRCVFCHGSRVSFTGRVVM